MWLPIVGEGDPPVVDRNNIFFRVWKGMKSNVVCCVFAKYVWLCVYELLYVNLYK